MRENPKQKTTRKNYGIDDFDSEELSLIFQIAERAIVKLPLELEEEFDISISDLSNLKLRISKYLDEDLY
tara:strand:+ start:853 stop:1062 length:210 start_codon:yes stop_codon:yes gene_type:complete